MNTDIWNYLNTKRYFECEIKNRWQRVTVNKWVIVIEPNHLNQVCPNYPSEVNSNPI